MHFYIRTSSESYYHGMLKICVGHSLDGGGKKSFQGFISSGFDRNAIGIYHTENVQMSQTQQGVVCVLHGQIVSMSCL